MDSVGSTHWPRKAGILGRKVAKLSGTKSGCSLVASPVPISILHGDKVAEEVAEAVAKGGQAGRQRRSSCTYSTALGPRTRRQSFVRSDSRAKPGVTAESDPPTFETRPSPRSSRGAPAFVSEDDAWAAFLGGRPRLGLIGLWG